MKVNNVLGYGKAYSHTPTVIVASLPETVEDMADIFRKYAYSKV